MKKIILIGILTFYMVSLSLSQSRYDTLISKLNTDSIAGKVPTYYTPGYRQIALEIQTTITEAIDFYEKSQANKFNVKLAVLDSTQWPDTWIPFGYVFYSKGWIFMNTGVEYEDFKDIYGVEILAEKLDSAMIKEGMTSTRMIESFYLVYSIHELGHYFMAQLTNARSPDNWTGEFIATYFAYVFFKNYNPSRLEEFKLFHKIDRNFYHPKYSSITDFNELYMGMGVENYVWYHSNFYFLVESLYGCYGEEFIPYFVEKFPRDHQRDFTTEELIKILEKDCEGVVSTWVRKLEKRTE